VVLAVLGDLEEAGERARSRGYADDAHAENLAFRRQRFGDGLRSRHALAVLALGQEGGFSEGSAGSG